MFSYHDSSRAQCGHADDGQTIDLPQRQAIDDRRSESCRSTAPNAAATTSANGGGRVVDHDGGRAVARRFVGQRPERGRLRQLHAAVRVSSYGVAGRIERHAAKHAGPHQRRPARSAAARRAACSRRPPAAARRSRRARAAAAAGARRPLRSQSISADCRIASHISRDDCRSPPCASVVAASDRSHHGAPGTSLALLNHSAAAR